MAWPLLALAGPALGLVLTTCLPPDYVIVPEVNLPVSIDKAQLVGPSPDVPHILSDCDALGNMRLELDPRQAIVNPDGDTIFSYWLVNYATSPATRPEQDDTRTTAPFAEVFTFDACTSPDNVVGTINTIELVVRDRPPTDETTGTGVHEVGDSDTTIDSVVWFVEVESTTCCGVVQ
ncbi:MAG: hypothetical protein U1F43_32805 [Myxococcota bacterium]